MEILATEEVMELSWWIPIAATILFLSGIVAIIAASNDTYVVFTIFVILCIISIIVLIATPTYTPTGKISHTIEITDPAQYQILVEKGYSFKRLFENKEIYTIIGDALQ